MFIRSASPANLHTNRTVPQQLSGSQADLRHNLYHTPWVYRSVSVVLHLNASMMMMMMRMIIAFLGATT